MQSKLFALLIVLAGYPWRVKSSVRVMCLKHRIQILIIKIISLPGQILLSYTDVFQTHTSHILCNHLTSIKRMGYVIIPKIFQAVKVKNIVVAVFTCCFFTIFAKSVATMIVVVVVQFVTVLTCCWLVINRDRRYRPFSMCRSLVHSTDTCAGLSIRDSFWVFFAYKKLLGRTEMRTRERKCFQSIRTV